MSKRSFEAINYMLRPNKNVERKLITSTLLSIGRRFDVGRYRYVGFGSMWFTDFVLMHKILGISDMVTIESQASRRKRVEFNKPYACINVRMEEASSALGEVLDAKPAVVWLDYDGALKSALTGDLETAVGAMVSGSMILVSVNARVEQLQKQQVDGVDVSMSQYLANICENDSLKAESSRLTKNDFPALVSEILHDRLKSAVLSSKPSCEFMPIWSFWYADDSDMVTVGGMVADAEAQALLDTCSFDFPGCDRTRNLFRIDLPILTEREKRALDKLLPSPRPLQPRDLQFELRPTEIEAYEKFYLQYPVFNEIAP